MVEIEMLQMHVQHMVDQHHEQVYKQILMVLMHLTQENNINLIIWKYINHESKIEFI